MSTFSSLWGIESHLKKKVIALSLLYGFLMGSQSIWRSMKSTIFAKLVGAAHVPDAKIISIFFLIPLILFYSRLVDTVKRHHIIYIFTLIHAIGGLFFALLLMHPTIGLRNTTPEVSRLTGWAYYLFMESFSAFLATSFWSFANSVNTPEEAKKYYSSFVSGSKLGGLGAAGIFWVILSATITPNSWLFTRIWGAHAAPIPDAHILPFALLLGSIFLFGAASCIYYLLATVPQHALRGYQATYQIEEKSNLHNKSFRDWVASMGRGFIALFSHSYVTGIFMLALFHDILMTLFDFQVLMKADKAYSTAGQMAHFYASYFFIMHSFGLAVTLFGTTPLQRLLGTRTALLLYPSACMGLVTATYFWPTTEMFFAAIVIMRALNYGLNYPIKEILYIPTTKDIRYKAKAWTDAFGTRIAKGSASFFYKSIQQLSPSVALATSSGVTFGITALWIGISYALGKTLQKTLSEQSVIGARRTTLHTHPPTQGSPKQAKQP